jgi:hypothetical protein
VKTLGIKPTPMDGSLNISNEFQLTGVPGSCESDIISRFNSNNDISQQKYIFMIYFIFNMQMLLIFF